MRKRGECVSEIQSGPVGVDRQGDDALYVGIREFRSDMAEYIASNTPVAITRHGQTVGFFIPTHNHAEADVAALKKASNSLERLLTAHAVDVDAVVSEFKSARKKKAVRTFAIAR